MMSGNAGSSNPAGKTVVLILPEALGDSVDPISLRKTLDSSEGVRVLLCLPDSSGAALLEALTTALTGLDVEVLLAPTVEEPKFKTTYTLRAPPSTSPEDQTEFALALSDMVVVASPTDESPFIRTAKNLGKPLITPGSPLPAIASYPSVTDYIDPNSYWHICGRYIFGRFEQLFLELFAFNWLERKKKLAAEKEKEASAKNSNPETGVSKSLTQLRKCVGTWKRTSSWPAATPDNMAVTNSSKISAGFEAMDRSAVYGSYIHRDFAWFAQFGAAFAVLFAVAGQLNLSHGRIEWGLAEIAILFAVAALVFMARTTGLQDRWMACRLGAEQLRIARMSLPLLVLPKALATEEKPPGGDGHSSNKSRLEFEALAKVKRVVREQGLPRRVDNFGSKAAAEWLHRIIDDQIAYHRNNHCKLDQAEDGLRHTTQALFGIVVLAVVAHFRYHDADWLLLVTAFGPAFAAALHGAGTRLGIVHRAALSLEVDTKLSQVDKALIKLINSPPPSEEETWKGVRKRAYEATEIMGSENTSWHGLVRRYRDELP